MKKIYFSPYIKVRVISSSPLMSYSLTDTQNFGNASDPSKGGGDGTVKTSGFGGTSDGTLDPEAKRQTLWGSPDVEE